MGCSPFRNSTSSHRHHFSFQTCLDDSTLSNQQNSQNLVKIPKCIHQKQAQKLYFENQFKMIKKQNQQMNSCSLEAMFPFIEKTYRLFEEITYLKSDVAEINSEVQKTLISMNKSETKELAALSEKFIYKHSMDVIQGKANYNDLKILWVNELTENNITDEELKFLSLTKIYHIVASLIRDPQLARINPKYVQMTQQSLPQVENVLQNHKHKPYDQYKQLKPQQLIEICKLELIEKKMEDFGEKFYRKCKDLEKASSDIFQMLQQSFIKHIDWFFSSERKWDLDKEEVLEVARISREAFSYSEMGFAILLRYLSFSCYKQEMRGFSTSKIESDLLEAIKLLGKQYPPGERLENSQALNKLKLLEVKKQQFNFNSLIFTEQNRRKQLDDFILENTKIAKKNEPHFQDLFVNTCMKNCIDSLSSLKLNPNNPRKKALFRVIEKILFKKEGLEKSTKTTIAGILQDQDLIYQANIEKKLINLQRVECNVTDLLRGKWTFTSAEDIIETIQSIKEYIEICNSKQPGLFRIIEIQNRFIRAVPNSDVSLNIAINQQTVVEMQLTLQANHATYDFAHKIYELNRCNIFSKIKILSIYNHEFHEDIEQLVGRALKLVQKGSKHKELAKNLEYIRQFFHLNHHPFELSHILNQHNKDILENHNFENLALNWPLMDSVLGRKMRMNYNVYCRQVMDWVDRHHQDWVKGHQQYSFVFMSMVKYQLYKDFDISEIAYKLKNINFEQFMQKYHLSDLTHVSYSSRIFIKYEQLSTLFQKGISIKFPTRPYLEIIQAIYGKSSIQHFKALINKGKYLGETLKFKEASITLIQALEQFEGNQINNPQLELLIYETRLLVAQNFVQVPNIESDSLRFTVELLDHTIKHYKAKKLFSRAVIGQLLRVECELLIEQDYSKFEKQYEKVRQMGDQHGLGWKGKEIGEIEWRIGCEMVKFFKNLRESLDIHIRMAIIEFSSYMNFQELSEKILDVWDLYDFEKLPKPQLKPNYQICRLDLGNQSFGSKKCQCFRPMKLPNLVTLYLSINKIDEKGCEAISQSFMPQLSTLGFTGNQIGDIGCSYLINPVWENLHQIFLTQNSIGEEGCKYLSRSNWPNLQRIDLNRNNINDEGFSFICEAKWPNLRILDLQMNAISDKGCQSLYKTNWKLEELWLRENKIKDEGCFILVQMNWPSLKQLWIRSNNIGSKGFQAISKGKWPKLGILDLRSNNADDQGCLSLLAAQWPQLQTLHIEYNTALTHNQQIGQKLKKKFPKSTVFA